MSDADRQEAPYTEGIVAHWSRVVSLICLWLAGTGLVAMSLIILWQVFARYVLHASPAWSEQLALYLLVWTVLLAAAAGVREQFHIRITAFERSTSPPARRILKLFAHGMTAVMGACIAIYGSELVYALWAYPIPTLGLPRGSAFACMPLAGALIVAFSVEHMLAIVSERSVRPAWD